MSKNKNQAEKGAEAVEQKSGGTAQIINRDSVAIDKDKQQGAEVTAPPVASLEDVDGELPGAQTPPVIPEPKNEAAFEIAKRFQVKKVFENSKGEYFTNHNLACLSEGGSEKNVATHDFSDKII